MSALPADVVVVTEAVLRECAPPAPQPHTDKGSRGRVLVVGGARVTPGAALLSGLAALRAGAGTLQLAVPESVAIPLALALPEALVQGVAETAQGVLSRGAAPAIIALAEEADSVLIGPGMFERDQIGPLLREVLPALPGATSVIIDAQALGCIDAGAIRDRGGRAVLTPNPGEMAGIAGRHADDVNADPGGTVRDVAGRFDAAIALRGGQTWATAPGQPLYCDQSGIPGLGTSGSGDVVAGLIAGLCARGSAPLHAVLWGVHVHAAAGRRAASRLGAVGFLARELIDEVSVVLNELSATA